MRFAKVTYAVEAYQMTRENRQNTQDWPSWLQDAWHLGRHELGSLHPTVTGDQHGTLSVTTTAGEALVHWGDWIVREDGGDIYPCNHEVFAAGYAMVQQPDRPVDIDGLIHDLLTAADHQEGEDEEFVPLRYLKYFVLFAVQIPRKLVFKEFALEMMKKSLPESGTPMEAKDFHAAMIEAVKVHFAEMQHHRVPVSRDALVDFVASELRAAMASEPDILLVQPDYAAAIAAMA